MRWMWCVLIMTLCAVVQAQPDPEPTKDGKMIYKLLLSPTNYPKPVSKSYLLPDYAESEPGSKVQGFLKCFMEQQIFFNYENEMKRDKFLQMKMEDLPADVRQQCGIHDGMAYEAPYSRLMVFMDRAARYSRTEWNEWHDLRKDGIYYLLPEVQKLRSISQVLRLRLRGEIKNREFDRGIVTVRSMFGLAKALEQHPTLIGNLVGIAICTQAINGLEEMIAQPGCPNLFWSFVDMPTHVLDIRYGVSGERLFITAQLDSLIKVNRVLSDKEQEKILKYIDEMTRLAGDSNAPVTVDQILNQPKVRYATYAADAKRLEAARARIVASGVPESLVRTYPPLQVVLHDDLLMYEVMRDEILKWTNVPTYQAREGIEASELEIRKLKKEFVLGPFGIAASWKVQEAMARTDQRIAYLRTIEAIRLHAFNNNNQLPAKLSDIKLPMADDPITGKPFNYTISGDTATLTGENPSRGNPRTNRVYEIKLRK